MLPTLRIAIPTLDTPLSPTLDAFTAKSTLDIVENFESTPDTETPLHGPYRPPYECHAKRLFKSRVSDFIKNPVFEDLSRF